MRMCIGDKVMATREGWRSDYTIVTLIVSSGITVGTSKDGLVLVELENGEREWWCKEHIEPLNPLKTLAEQAE